MSRLSRNLVANFIGRGWGAVLAFVFVPFYLRFLGIEAYGLVGFFATLQVIASLTDLGLGMTLNREMARLSVPAGRTGEQRDVLRTLEAVFLSTSLFAGLVIAATAEWIAAEWIGASELAPGTVVGAVRLMGVVLALQLPSALYQGGLLGLQKQTLVNGIIGVSGTLRGVGAVLVLWQVSPTVEAFFAWQAAVSALQTGLTGWLLWRSLHAGAHRPRFRAEVVRRVWRYAAGLAGSTLVGAGLTQADKLLLSSILPLRQFGYYTLAWSLAAALWAVTQPVHAAFFPRLTQMVEARNDAGLAGLYHTACQIVAVLVIPVAVTIAVMPTETVYLWTGDRALAENTALLVRLLMLGTLLNALASVPVALQMAAGWSQLMLWTNVLSAAFLIPAILVVAPRWGGPGAAGAWIGLNVGYLLFSIPVMHRRLLRGEQWTWYWVDLARPLFTALALASALHLLLPGSGNLLVTAARLLATWLLLGLVLLALSPAIRTEIASRLRAARAARSLAEAHST